MPSPYTTRASDFWFSSTTDLLESYADSNFKGNKLARDESIDFLEGEIKLKAYLVAVANLSKDTQALDQAIGKNKINAHSENEISNSKCEVEDSLIEELHSRLKTLTFLQISSIHANMNIPNKNRYTDLILQTRDTLFEIALTLGDETIIRLLATELLDSAHSDDHRRGLILRLRTLYPDSEIITQKILGSFSRNHFEDINPLDLLEEIYEISPSCESVIVSEVLENFEAFLPINYNDLDQALLLRFLGARMDFDHIDEIYARFFSLDISAETELECVLLDRIAVIKNDRSNTNADQITKNFRKEIDSFSIPDDWGLN